MVDPARRAPPRAVKTKRPSKARWTRLFIARLAETSNVSAAARKAGVSTSTAYELRRHDAVFAKRWFEALCEGYDNLELELLARLRLGEVRPTGTVRAKARSFDNATALRLLTAHRESVARTRALRDDDDADTVLASINAKLDRMRERALSDEDDAPAGLNDA